MTQRDLDVVVVGNVGVDTNVFAPGEIDLVRETHFTENLDGVGQAGGYTSRGFAQLGYRTAFVGHVGDDWAGRFVREALERDGVDTSALFVDPAGTARSVNLMLPDGGRRTFYDGKSHMTLDVDLDACRRALARARLAHFHLPNWARRLLPVARELGLTISCDLQDVRDVADPYRQDFIDDADILFFSAAWAGRPEEMMDAFLERAPGKVLVMGMGERGCALGNGGEVRTFPPPELDLPVVDTNGAGDGLAVGFLASWVLEGLPLEEAILRGQVAARHTCAQRASSDRLIRRQDLSERARRARALDNQGESV